MVGYRLVVLLHIITLALCEQHPTRRIAYLLYKFDSWPYRISLPLSYAEPYSYWLLRTLRTLRVLIMTVTLSSKVMRAMGFQPFEVCESISASFVSFSVYEIRGITLQSGSPQITAGTIGNAKYHIAVGAKLNETCYALAGNPYVEDESAWTKGKGSSGPFLIIQLGPTQMYTITEGQIKIETDGSVTTFDSFSSLRTDLASLETTTLPQLITSLACQLAGPNQYLELRRLDHTSVGRTTSGKVLHDIRHELSAHGYVSRCLPPDALSDGLKGAVTLAPCLNTKAARFFTLGMAEKDELKKFLYFFLALEVETHAVFRRIDHAQALRKLLDPALHPTPTTVALLQRQADQLRNLSDRFVWCATCVWSGITEADVGQFKRLKATRNDIAHGTISEPPGGSAQLAQQLARKVLQQ